MSESPAVAIHRGNCRAKIGGRCSCDYRECRVCTRRLPLHTLDELRACLKKKRDDAVAEDATVAALIERNNLEHELLR